MASYHVVYGSGKDGAYALQVEFHIPVPIETIVLTNQTLQGLLSTDADYDKTSTFADATELTQLQAGEIVKIVKSINTNNGLTDAQIRTRIRNTYDSLAISVIDDLRRKYKAYSYSEIKGVNF